MQHIPRISFQYAVRRSIPVSARSKGVGLRPLACWDCGFETRRRHGCLSFVNVVCCAGRGLCVGLITRPEESYRLWCAWVWMWCLDNEGGLAHKGLMPQWGGLVKKTKHLAFHYAVFPSLLLLPPTLSQISSSVPYSLTPTSHLDK